MAKLNLLSQTINCLLRRPVVEKITGKSRSTIYRDVSNGLLTKPVSIGGERVAWPQNEIEAINQARIAGKSDEEIKQLVIDLEAARGCTNPPKEKKSKKNASKVTNVSSLDSGLLGAQ